MTAFVLVSGPFTGGWLWEEIVAPLRAAGSEAYPVTLSGMGAATPTAREMGAGTPTVTGVPNPSGAGDRQDDGAGSVVDLETHIDDLVRLIDAIDTPRVVLVGHGYGLHPVLGAADRRPERVARIVSLDTSLPEDGEAAVRSVPDPEVRARVADVAAGSGGRDGGERVGGGGADGGRVPPPGPGEWARWGSTEGVPAEALERLERLATPQPAATLTQPLRLTGAGATLPTTGILCTAGGSGIDVVRMLVESGPPRFRALADDRMRYFDLGTGHWPMLSAPEELAELLRRAAAGEGDRVTVPEAAEERPARLLPFLLDTPEVPRERHGRVDLHLPDADGPRPAVVFVHGGPVSPDQRPTPRDTPFLRGYGRYAASLGVVGATPDHRLYGLADFPLAAEDLAEAVDIVRADPRVDGERIALWFFSAGGLLAADWLAVPPPWLRCVAMTYPALAPLPGWGTVESRFRPVDAVGAADGPPIVLTRAGREHPTFAATVEQFRAAAARKGADVEVVDVPHGRHGFELVDPTEESRAAVRRAMRSVLGRLRS
ncbi:dienelactone hydrolase family protein [Streptomyces zaomyceticus]|uniref:dienelactone hydrolase family protein n=1 Tax=Streptomyces zaomyceticus TaxID=68286 RepID=UPI003664A400